MSDKPDPDKTDPEQIKGPGGMNMRELHELVKKSHARDQISRGQRVLNDCGARRVALVLASRPRAPRPGRR